MTTTPPRGLHIGPGPPDPDVEPHRRRDRGAGRTSAASLPDGQLGAAASLVIDGWEAIETTAVALGLVIEPDTWDTRVVLLAPSPRPLTR